MLAIDIETYSSIDITKCGVYAYTEAEDFTILLFSYAYDDEEIKIIDLACGEKLPKSIIDDLTNPKIIKTAFNANFERTCLAKYLNKPMSPKEWRCSAVHSLELGLPTSLDKVSKCMNLDQQKMNEGKALIRYFSMPCKPIKANGGRTRNLPEDNMEKWNVFKTYCRQDVEVERAIRKKLERFPVTEKEWQLWALDQKINDSGVKIDKILAQNAIKCDKSYQDKKIKEAINLTGLENPNSPAQLKEWLESKSIKVKSLSKEKVKELLEEVEDETVKRVLRLRKDLSKTSVRKYEAMERAMCRDERIRGLMKFYGASRTGRWCLTGDHEILTSKGWCRFDKWEGGYIACWSPKTEFISFKKAKAVSFDYNGELYSINSKRCSQLSTPEHTMPYWDKTSGWKSDTIQNLANKRFSIPFTGRRFTNSSLEHNELRVLIMVQADGHYTENGDLRFHFSKKRKIERCKSLLRKVGIIFSISICEKSTVVTIKSRHMPLWLRTFKDKTFKMWLLDESADVIFDELELWDGYRCGPNSIQYSTINKQNADIIQALAHLSGRAATIIKKNGRKNNWSEIYVVNIWLTPLGRNEIREKPKEINFSGKVYCAETETGFFIVRRKGKVWITGNSGKLVQTQNLPRNSMDNLRYARELLKAGDFEMLEILFDSVPNVLSQLIRTAFIPSINSRFIVSDFSAIEARVIAWLAGERWVIDTFKSSGKIYEMTASRMFGVPIEKIVKGNPEYALRQKGKVATLACGYQGSAGALIAMGAIKMGLKEEELPEIVAAWRESNPSIVRLWRKFENAAIKAVDEKKSVKMQYGLEFSCRGGVLFIKLPSGRSLAYVRPRIEADVRFNKAKLTYEGIEQGTKQWGRISTYGGKLTENIVQAIARDCLAEAMLRLDTAGYKIVFHVHDEVILDVPNGFGSLGKVNEIMGESIDWAPGLPLKADGFEADYYKKD